MRWISDQTFRVSTQTEVNALFLGNTPAGGGGGGGVFGVSGDGDDAMGAKIKTQKFPRASNKNQKSLDQKLTPKNSDAEFLTLKFLSIKKN